MWTRSLVHSVVYCSGCFLHTLSSVGLSNNSRNDNFATAQKGEKPDIECRISLFDISDRINFRLRPARGRSGLPAVRRLWGSLCSDPGVVPALFNKIVECAVGKSPGDLEVKFPTAAVVKDWDIKIKTIYKLENSIYCGVTWHFMFAPCQIYAKLAIHPMAMSSFFHQLRSI